MTTRERWQLQRLFAAPHRLAFAAGATVLALSALWWSAAMLARAGGHALPSGLPQTEAHGLVMVLGFMPLFFVGFLFTAGPRWLRVPARVHDGRRDGHRAGVSHVLEALSLAAAAPLGVAALHALTMGFLGSTLITMGARISCGHGGRSQTADDVLWRLFWILQLAAVLRIAASLHGGSGLLAAAARAWAASCAAWALRYLRWYGRPRADGRPG